MPTTTNIRVINLGPHRDLDPNEGRNGAELASDLVGRTFGGPDSPLANNIERVSLYDSNSDGRIPFDSNYSSNWWDNDRGDNITHAAGPTQIDTGIYYRGTVTYMDGTTANNIPLRVFQDTFGNLALVPPPRGASQLEINGVTSKPIQSIHITDIIQNNFTHLDTSRYGLEDAPAFPCFCNGTRILTDRGDVAVEDLKVGDMIVTRDHGLQELRWIGSKSLPAAVLHLFPKLRPVRIGAGALGNGLPLRDLLVSQQHRVLVKSKIAERMFGNLEVLVAAKSLTEIDGIAIEENAEDLVYFHLLFDQHEIVVSEGAATESLFTGEEALRSLDPAARQEILAIFPELIDPTHESQPARTFGNTRQGRKLAHRHAVNQRSLQSESAN